MIATVVVTIKKVNEYVKVELCSKGSYTGNTGCAGNVTYCNVIYYLRRADRNLAKLKLPATLL